MATGTEVTASLLQVTRTVPIVFVLVPDPVGAGFVDSLARPGRNVTGFTPFEYGIRNRTATWQEVLSGHDAEGVGIRWAVELEPQGTAYLR